MTTAARTAMDSRALLDEDVRGRRVGSWFVSAMLALAAFGVAIDVSVVTRLGGEGAASLVASAVLATPLVAAAGIHFIVNRNLRAIPSPFFAILAFVGWSAASLFWSINEDETIKRTLTNAQLVAFVWLGWQVIRSESELRATIAGFVAGCVLLVALTWKNYVTGEFIRWGRLTADGFDPNDMSVYLAIGIPMACYLAVAGRGRISLLALLYLPAAFSALALSGSRTGLLSMAVAVASVAVWVARRNVTALVAMLALVGAGIVLAGVLVPADNWSRLLTTRSELGGGMGSRTEIWRAGADVLGLNPVAGIGAGSFPDAVAPAMYLRMVAHSTLLSIAVELGAIGLVLFLAVLVSLLRWVRWSALDEKALAWSLVLTVCMGTVSLSWEARKPMWLVFLLGSLLGALSPGHADPERA